MIKDNKQYIYKPVLKYIPRLPKMNSFPNSHGASCIERDLQRSLKTTLKNVCLAIQQIQKFSHQLPINTITWRSKSYPELIRYWSNHILFC